VTISVSDAATVSSGAAVRGMEAALAPVASALLDAAHHHAESIVGRAQVEADTDTATARCRGERVVADARRQGAEVAGRLAALRVASARRQGRQLVLEARRRAYQSLRRRATEALELQKDSIEAHQLMRRLVDAAVARLGAGVPGAAPAPEVHSEGMSLEVVSGARRVRVDPADLVDLVLAPMSEKVEALWV
jgi:cell division septum initiation protein DivIVA